MYRALVLHPKFQIAAFIASGGRKGNDERDDCSLGISLGGSCRSKVRESDTGAEGLVGVLSRGRRPKHCRAGQGSRPAANSPGKEETGEGPGRQRP